MEEEVSSGKVCCCQLKPSILILCDIINMSFNALLFSQRPRKRSRSVSIESNSVESETGHDSVNQVTDYFPASKLFEYQWPLGEEGAEHYMLQEHVKEYLDIRGMQRKYPGQSVHNYE